MDFITQNITLFWLVAGALFVLLEAVAVPGIGFLFAGFAAITTGGLIQAGLLSGEQYSFQIAIFLGSIVVWAAILWVPMKKFHHRNKVQSFSNIIGDTAVVYKDGLTKGKPGEVKWSGTIMSAVLSEKSALANIAEGEIVKIEAIEGNVLIVTPR